MHTSSGRPPEHLVCENEKAGSVAWYTSAPLDDYEPEIILLAPRNKKEASTSDGPKQALVAYNALQSGPESLKPVLHYLYAYGVHSNSPETVRQHNHVCVLLGAPGFIIT